MAPGRPSVAMGLRPGGAIEGRGRVPGSKSQAQRALVCAALAEGTSEILGRLDGSDVCATRLLVESLGARVQPGDSERVRVTGCPPGLDRGWSAPGSIDAGESGTLARFATAVLGLCGRRDRWYEVGGVASLLRRKSPPLFDALSRSGVKIEWISEPGGWPVRLNPAKSPDRVDLQVPISSQEASALMIAMAGHEGERTLWVHGEIPSRPYLALTLDVLRIFGVSTGAKPGPGNEVFSLRGPMRAPSHAIAIEPDASSAAVLLAAASLSGGGVEVAELGDRSAQPDARAPEHLRRFGVEAGSRPGALSARGSPTRGAEVDLSGAPDLAPVLAAVAAAAAIRAGGESRLLGLGTLPGKESSRIEVLASGLSAAGLDARAGSDSLEIRPGRGRRTGSEVRLDPRGDHRMAFAFALLGLVIDGVTIADPGCVGKSWPGFWTEMERLGAQVVRKR